MLPKFVVVVLLLFFSSLGFASTQTRVLTGTKVQSFKTADQAQVGSSPLGLIGFVDFELTQKFYFSFGTSFELSTDSFSTSGFSLYASALYYLYGTPNMIGSEDGIKNADLQLYYPYSIYLSLGIFQKELKLRRQGSTIQEDESVGGLSLGAGFNYNLNSRMYLNSHVQALTSGLSTNLEYTSFEFYLGVGLRI